MMMKKKIVSEEDIVKLHKSFKYIGGKVAARFVIWLLRINKINEVYSKSYTEDSSKFVDSIYENLKLSYFIDKKDLEKIPNEKAFILISNHPFGGAEAIITLKFIKDIRPDFKFMANFLLDQIEPLKPYFISVNPFETMRSLKSNITGLKLASKHVQNGHALGIFPAGEVSTYQNKDVGITDKEWPKSIMKFIKSQNVEIIPVFFEGNNSHLFHFLGKIHPLLRTLKLPSELLNKKNKTIKLRIGNPISIKSQENYNDISDFTNYLRKNTYGLVNQKS